MFAKSPAFTFAAVTALTLGIGVNTAISRSSTPCCCGPSRSRSPDRLVVFMNTGPQGGVSGASPAKFQHYREQADVVQDVGAYRTGVVNYTGGNFPEQLRSGQVTREFFKLFGAPSCSDERSPPTRIARMDRRSRC